MVSDSDSSSSDDSRHEKSRKRKREVSPDHDRRPSKKEKHVDKSRSRDDRKESDDSHRDRSHRHKDNRYRGKRDDRPTDKRRYDKSPPQKEERHRKHNENNDYNKRYNKQKKSSFNDVKIKKEPSPEWGKPSVKNEPKSKPQEKEKPNFELSGKLTEDANTVNGVVIKYAEPAEARKPKRRWRLYPFKGEKALPTLYIHRQSAYLMGRDRKIADIPLDHPSCSKQHAALQYRLVSFDKEGGGQGKRIRPYLIDLDSANGTFVNNVKLEPRRYHELLERDVVRFGFSTREYVLLHEHSKDDSLDDDVPFTADTTANVATAV